MLTETEKNNERENTSGQGKNAAIPPEIRGWSWGGFLLTWIWGIGNDTYRAFWCLFPIFGLFMRIALGIQGREWAWRYRKWDSIEHFKRTQKRWGLAGLIVILVGILFWGLMMGVALFSALSMLNYSEPTKMALEFVQENSQLNTILGSPIEKTGSATGDIKMKDLSGAASLAFAVKGANSTGHVEFTACRDSGKWYITQLTYNDNKNNSTHITFSPQITPPCA